MDNQSQPTNYKRVKSDLNLQIDMSLEEALLSRPIQFTTLDGRSISINLDKMITPQTVHKIEGEGMPKLSNSTEKGDLYINFNIIFPTKIRADIKDEIVDILRQEVY